MRGDPGPGLRALRPLYRRLVPVRRLRDLIVWIALCVASPAVAQDRSPVGVWLHANERIRVEISPCNAGLCGEIVWFRWPNDDAGLPLVDLKNRDPALRNRPLLGLRVIEGLRPDGKGKWVGGRIYNPDDGRDYRADLTVGADGILRVRAYVLLPILGKTLLWTKVP